MGIKGVVGKRPLYDLEFKKLDKNGKICISTDSISLLKFPLRRLEKKLALLVLRDLISRKVLLTPSSPYALL